MSNEHRGPQDIACLRLSEPFGLHGRQGLRLGRFRWLARANFQY